LTWNEGEHVEIDTLSGKHFQMSYLGKTFSAKLRDDGKLYWSDGDVWSRRVSLPPWLNSRTRTERAAVSERIASSTYPEHAEKVPCRSVLSASASQVVQPLSVSYAAVARPVERQQHVMGSVGKHVQQPIGLTVVKPSPLSKTTCTGIVSVFRGSWGWVDCASVQMNYNGRQIYLHKNDCDFNPWKGDKVEFLLALDPQGNPKAVNAKRHREPDRISYEDWLAMRQKK